MKFTCFFKNRPYLIVLGGFLVNLSIGDIYSTANIRPNIYLYMRNNSLSGESITPSNSIWIVGLLIFGVGSAVSAGGFLEKKIGSSLTVLIGGLIMSVNVIFAYFTIKTYLSLMAISSGLFSGIGAGLAYGVSIGAPIKWFPKHKGLVIGIVVAGSGLSSSIFTAIQSIFLGFSGQKNLADLPITFVVLGSSYAILQILGSILMRENVDVSESNLNSLRDNSDMENHSGLFRLLFTEAGLKPHQLFYEYDFWIIWLSMLFIGSSITIFQSLYMEFVWMNAGLDINFTIINIICGLCNASGKVFWGYLTIRKPYKALLFILSLANSLFVGSFYFLGHIRDDTTFLYIFGVWVAIINFFQEGYFSVFPTVCEKIFGENYFVCNFGLLFTSVSVCGIIVSTVINYFEFETSPEIFLLKLFSIGAAMSLIGSFLVLLIRGKSLYVSRYYRI